MALIHKLEETEKPGGTPIFADTTHGVEVVNAHFPSEKTRKEIKV